MSDQSPLEQIKSARISKSALIALIAGLVAGLGLGLLIGWVWWPVDWQGAVPAASIAADPAIQANYVAAVADAYAASNTPEAARLAADRMQALGDDPRTAVDGAIQYFADQPGGAARIANLATMASAIGVPVTAQITQLAPTATVAPATATAAPATQTANSPNWFAWLLVLLTALLLIGGGIYLLWRLAQKQRDDANGAEDATVTGFTDEEIGATATTGAFSRSSLAAPVATGAQPATGAPYQPLPARAAQSVAATARPADPYAFDDEDDDGVTVYRPDAYPPDDGEVSEEDLDEEDEQEVVLSPASPVGQAPL
ncbi:MAG: hypothetical protein IPK16_03670 [Anaerolineales bacterium]|nr:hypothetical protein [Anaerolineales bacterium]